MSGRVEGRVGRVRGGVGGGLLPPSGVTPAQVLTQAGSHGHSTPSFVAGRGGGAYVLFLVRKFCPSFAHLFIFSSENLTLYVFYARRLKCISHTDAGTVLCNCGGFTTVREVEYRA